MAFLGNIIYFITGGWAVGLLYLIGAVIFFPLLPFLLPFVMYSFAPLGKKAVSKQKINDFKKSKGEDLEEDALANASGALKFIANVVWVFTFGVLLAIVHLMAALANMLFCVLIITIPICFPNALANWRLIPVAFAPFGAKILPIKLAEEIELSSAASKL